MNSEFAVGDDWASIDDGTLSRSRRSCAARGAPSCHQQASGSTDHLTAAIRRPGGTDCLENATVMLDEAKSFVGCW